MSTNINRIFPNISKFGRDHLWQIHTSNGFSISSERHNNYILSGKKRYRGREHVVWIKIVACPGKPNSRMNKFKNELQK